MSNKGKTYTKKNLLTPEEFERFAEFIKAANISVQELADFDEIEKKAMYVRLKKKRIKKRFAQDFAKSKREALEEKFKNLDFNV